MPLRNPFVVAALLTFATSRAGAADPPGSTPPIPPALVEYQGREIAQTMHYLGADWLTRESRDREEDCVTLLKVLKLRPGQVVCDMGCGNGFYALRIAKQVEPGGRVLCVDIQPEMLTLLRERSRAAKVENVRPILGSVVDPQLPAESCDLILCIDVYHEFSHPVHMLAALHKALKPQGRLVLVEFRLEDPAVPIKLEHKMSKAQVRKELEPNGFRLVDQFDGLPWQHVLWFEKAAAAGGR